MIAAFLSALSEIFDPRLRRVLILSLLLAAAVLAALAGGLAFLLHHTTLFDIWYLDGAIELLGGFAILVLTWLLFPAVATLVLGFFLDGAIATVEARRYPGLPPPSDPLRPPASASSDERCGSPAAANAAWRASCSLYAVPAFSSAVPWSR